MEHKRIVPFKKAAKVAALGTKKDPASAGLLREQIFLEIGRHTKSEDLAIDYILICFLMNRPVLFDGPSANDISKIFKNFSQCFGGFFRRIPFSADLWPTDVLGHEVRTDKLEKYGISPGPIFTNFLLMENIHLAMPRALTAFVDVFNNGQVMIGAEVFSLPQPFLACAIRTGEMVSGHDDLSVYLENVVGISAKIDYPTLEEDIQRLIYKKPAAKPIVKIAQLDDVICLRNLLNDVEVGSEHIRLIAQFAFETRQGKLSKHILAGLTADATLDLKRAAQARAMILGRNHVIADDIRELALPVVQHRCRLNFAARADGETVESIIGRICNNVF